MGPRDSDLLIIRRSMSLEYALILTYNSLPDPNQESKEGSLPPDRRSDILPKSLGGLLKSYDRAGLGGTDGTCSP